MADLSVDIDGLESVSAALRSVAAGLDDTRAAIAAVASELGSDDVHDALDAFESHWDDGRGQIKKNMTAVEKALDAAVRDYRGTDRDLAAALHREETVNRNVRAM